MADRFIWDETVKGSNSSVNTDNPLKVTTTKTSLNAVRTNLPLTKGKFYMELYVQGTSGTIGICTENFNPVSEHLESANHISLYLYDLNLFPSGSSGLTALPDDNIWKIKLDLTNKVVYFGTGDDQWSNAINLPSGTQFYPVIMNASSFNSMTVLANFGETDFKYKVPVGYMSPNDLLTKILIKVEDKYYSIKDDNYDSTNKIYNEVELNSSNFDDLSENLSRFTKEVTIGDETFKPIDKFDKFRFIFNKYTKTNVYGIKSKKQMVIGKNYILTSIANNIDYFKHVFSIGDGCSIKVAIDNGEGIYYTTDNGVNWAKSDLVLPEKNYNDLTTEELTNWNAIRDEVYANGFDISETENIDFNGVLGVLKKVKFIYVIEITSQSDTCNTTELDWKFDAIGSFLQLSKSELEISISNNNVTAKALKDINLLKVNVGCNETINVQGEETIIETTDEEMDNIISFD